MHKKHNDGYLHWLILILLTILGFFIRYNLLRWDDNFHLHPDERMLIMVAEKLSFFSNLNPHFFNYGSLPIYLLKGIGDLYTLTRAGILSNYDTLLPVGRVISSVVDSITISVVYALSYSLFKNKKGALSASFFYAISFFPIQNSHFFIVDVFINFFALVTVLLLTQYWRHQRLHVLFFIALCVGAGIASKFTFVLFAPLVALVILFRKEKNSTWLRQIMRVAILGTGILFATIMFMPYMYVDFASFLKDVLFQLRMNGDPYSFPYTRQYIGTTPYLYQLKNIFLWGMGPIISLLACCGIVMELTAVKEGKRNTVLLLTLSMYSIYFLVLGNSAVKFMRYMLPLYPLIAIFAGIVLTRLGKVLAVVLLLSAGIWTYGFLKIYTKPHTRVDASEWIVAHVPSGSTLAVEHWDDRLPLFNSDAFHFEELPLYDIPDDKLKWKKIDHQLSRTDYLIIASNRLYAPLMRVTDCKKYLLCYPRASDYYYKLFNGGRGFTKVAEFTSYPTWELGGIRLELNDDYADESFTVYDHPKIMIFKRN